MNSKRNVKWLNGLWLTLFILVGSSCTVKIPNTKACSVAGVISAGAICAHTLTDETEDMTLPQFLEFLEPQKDRGPAICVSTDDFAKFEAALEQACTKLKCSKDIKEQIKNVSTRISKLNKKKNFLP